MTQKIFTPQEANKRLPLVKKIVCDILSKGQKFRAAVEKNTDDELSAECVQLTDEINILIKELEDLGCYYKDWNFEAGLVDFPSVLDGLPVLLCWRSDEPSLGWYHTLEGGYAARRPIPEQLLH